MLKQFHIVIQIVVAAEKQEWVRLAGLLSRDFIVGSSEINYLVNSSMTPDYLTK